MNAVQKKSETVSVSVIIPARNGAVSLRRVLTPLLPAPGGWEILVVDDASTDETSAIARSLGVPVVPSDGRLNDLTARNTGARLARGEILVFLDADVVTGIPDITRSVERLREENIGCIFAVYDRGYHLQNTVSRYKNFWIRHSTLTASRPLHWISTSLAIIRKETFRQVNGFDEYFTRNYGGGDLDFGRRVASIASPIVADETFQVAHFKHLNLRGLWLNEQWRAQGWFRTAIARDGLFSVIRRPSLANVSSRFSYGVVATAAGALLAVLTPFFPVLFLWAVAAFFAGLAFNFSFIKEAVRQRIPGWPFFIPLLWFDQIACASGLCMELTTFILSGGSSVRRSLSKENFLTSVSPDKTSD